MATRAGVLIALTLALTTTGARDCIELTLPSKFDDSILNRTLISLDRRYQSDYSVLDLWDRFPKVIVPGNATSAQCRRDSQLFLEGLDRLELWALKSTWILIFIKCTNGF